MWRREMKSTKAQFGSKSLECMAVGLHSIPFKAYNVPQSVVAPE